MKLISPRFPVKRPSFQKELRLRVNAYFEENDLSITGNLRLYVKAITLISVFSALYVLLVFFTPVWYIALPAAGLLGITLAGIGFNIMHDGSHGSFSKSHAWNKAAAFTLDFFGASSFLWSQKHNMIHHTYTNIDGIDEDIDIRPMLRIASTQKRYWFHKYQHIYCIPVYGLAHIFWIVGKDFRKYFLRKIGNVPVKEVSATDHLTFWMSKASFLFFFIGLPLYFIGSKMFIPGFIVFSICSGITLGLVFQLAHAVEHTEFPIPNADDQSMEDEWAAIQVRTTANFATKNPIVTWFTGGLNFQIEHHLFPKVSHVHYPALSVIVKETCNDFDLNYVEFPSMKVAIESHLRHMKELGAVA